MKHRVLGIFLATATLASCGNTALASTPVSQPVTSGWQFRAVADTNHAGTTEWHAATIPGEVHTDLLAAGLIPDPFYADNEKREQWIGEQDWEYRTELRPTADVLARKHIDLVFDGIDTFAEVTLNGHPLLKTDNMFRTWKADVRPWLHAGNNELRVVLQSPYKVMTPQVAALPYVLPGSGYEAFDRSKGVFPIGQYIRTAGYEYGWDWGPKLVTMGMWRPVHLDAWDDYRITDLHLEQTSVNSARALLTVNVEVEATHAGTVQLDFHLGTQGSAMAAHTTQLLDAGANHLQLTLRLPHPRLWFPAGYGEQVRYLAQATLRDPARQTTVDTATRQVGLRSVELRRQPDQWGTSFTFVVNGIPIFAKGANVIPMDSFPARVTPARERALLTAARDANMNMVRLWGGGYYQTDSFYSVADELGILVWQEFMFGGGLVPGDKAFQDNVRAEAIEQVKRLRDHPSVVFWCGNNEVESAWMQWGDHQEFKKSVTPEQRERIWQDYVVMFRDILKSTVAQYGGGVPYGSSSPSAEFDDAPGSSRNGDMHSWNVWSAAAPITDYQKIESRFVSEYGFQGMPDLATVRAFAGQEEDFHAAALANHERFAHGFDRLQLYMEQETGKPRDFAAFDYLSQFLQAEAIQMAAEHFRSSMPQTMGSMYWQLNDCWPVVSWASIDYFGRPKALQYYAKRFYAPVAVAPVFANGQIEVHLISDKQQPTAGTLKLRVMDFHGKLLAERSQSVTVPPLSSLLLPPVATGEIAGFDPRQSLAVLEFVVGGKAVASHTLSFAKVKDQQLPVPTLKADLAVQGKGFSVTLQSDSVARCVQLAFPGLDATLSDNFVDVLPGQPVTIHVESAATLDQLRSALELTSLASALASK